MPHILGHLLDLERSVHLTNIRRRHRDHFKCNLMFLTYSFESYGTHTLSLSNLILKSHSVGGAKDVMV